MGKRNHKVGTEMAVLVAQIEGHSISEKWTSIDLHQDPDGDDSQRVLVLGNHLDLDGIIIIRQTNKQTSGNWPLWELVEDDQ